MKHLRIESVSFRPSTSDEYPHGIYLCSKALAALSMRDHCTILRPVRHRDSSNVIACLHKSLSNSHDIVYHLNSPLRLTLDRRSYISDIDIYFTDIDGTKLEGDYVATSTPGTQLSDLETMHDSGNGNLKRVGCPMSKRSMRKWRFQAGRVGDEKMEIQCRDQKTNKRSSRSGLGGR